MIKLSCHFSATGYCGAIIIRLVTDDELSQPQFVRGLRATALAMGYSASEWVDRLSDIYRDFDGVIIDEYGNELMLDLEVFEFEHGRTWFRDQINAPMAEGVSPRLRAESKERLRILGTVLKMVFPREALSWLAANDNHPISRR
jgi:hypothetical protein